MFPFVAALRAKHRESLRGYGETSVLHTCVLYCIIGFLVFSLEESGETFVSTQSHCVVRKHWFSFMHFLGNKVRNVEKTVQVFGT